MKRQLKIFKNYIKLSKYPIGKVNPHYLRQIHPGELEKIFNNNEIEPLWNQVKDRTKTIFSEERGGINPGDQKALFYLIHQFKPQSVLEVGTHIGCSAFVMASALQLINNSYTITTVDIIDVNDIKKQPWLQSGMKDSPQTILESHGLQNQVNFISSNSISFLKNTNKNFDFIFLDGSHSAKTVYQEVPLALNKLNDNGLVLLHDYFPKGKPLWDNNRSLTGPYTAISKLRARNRKLQVVPLGNLPWQTKMNSNTTSLAILSCY